MMMTGGEKKRGSSHTLPVRGKVGASVLAILFLADTPSSSRRHEAASAALESPPAPTSRLADLKPIRYNYQLQLQPDIF